MASPYAWDKELNENKNKFNPDIFESGAQVLVNPVNCVGVMGAGLAKVFRQKYPDMFLQYKSACEHGRYKPGYCFIQKVSDGHFVANIATKDHWKDKSEYEWIKQGIRNLREDMERKPGQGRRQLESVAIPRIGCGLGGLEWDKVRSIIIKELEGCHFDVWLDGEVFLRNRNGQNEMGQNLPSFETPKTIVTCKYCGIMLPLASVTCDGTAVAVCGRCLKEALHLLEQKNEKAKAQSTGNKRNWRDEPITKKQAEMIKSLEAEYKAFEGKNRGDACDYIKVALKEQDAKKEKDYLDAEGMWDSMNGDWGVQR